MTNVGRKVLLAVGFVVLLASATSAIRFVSRQAFAPWSVALPGQPALTGAWEGPLHARLGAEYHVFVDLRYEQTGLSGARSGRSRRGSRALLKGTGRICAPTGTTYPLNVDGNPDRAGQNLELKLSHTDPSQSGLWLGLRGTWQADRLALTPTRNQFFPDGRFQQLRSYSTDDPDDPFVPTELRRGTLADFEASCRRLPAPR